MFYSKSTGGFYTEEIHGSSIPLDAVEISDSEYHRLISGQSSGKLIKSDQSGFPILSDRPPPSEEQIIARYETALDNMLNTVAQGYRYADRTRLALRAGYPNQNQALAIAFGTWMDSCNDQAKQLYLDVKAGTVQMPTLEQFISGFSPFVAP